MRKAGSPSRCGHPAAANLAGRHDIGAELAQTCALQRARLPFAEPIDFLRAKLNIPTQAWTDLWHEQHDKAASFIQ